MTIRKRLSGPERRRQLMEVGRAAFAARGFEATALDDVAQRAGVSKPIVYEHFGSKEGMYAAIVEREMDVLVARVHASIASGPARERFERAVLAFLTYAREEPEGFAVLTRESPAATIRRGLTRVIDDLAARVGDVFRSEFERAGYPPKIAPIYANALLGMVTQVGQWWAVDGRSFTADEVARHVTALGWMGLRHLPREPRRATRGKKPRKAAKGR